MPSMLPHEDRTKQQEEEQRLAGQRTTVIRWICWGAAMGLGLVFLVYVSMNSADRLEDLPHGASTLFAIIVLTLVIAGAVLYVSSLISMLRQTIGQPSMAMSQLADIKATLAFQTEGLADMAASAEQRAEQFRSFDRRLGAQTRAVRTMAERHTAAEGAFKELKAEVDRLGDRVENAFKLIYSQAWVDASTDQAPNLRVLPSQKDKPRDDPKR